MVSHLRTEWVMLLFLTVLLAACSSPEPPPRLPSIPSEAVWVGGVDGGVWIWCKEARDLNFCTVYNEHSGEEWKHGGFVVEGTHEGVSSRELQYDYFDGERIGLQDGRVLEPDK